MKNEAIRLLAEVINKSNLDWLNTGLLYATLHGSHAYGTATETSDIDIKGVAVPPSNYLHGFADHFEQTIASEPADCTIYDIRKFFGLAADCNPNIIEVLWTDESDHLWHTPAFELVLDKKSLFLSKKARYTFTGYAISQLKRIKTHRKWLLNPPEKKPERSDFDLPDLPVIAPSNLKAAESMIRKQLDRWSFKDMEELDQSARISAMESMSNVLAEIMIGTDDQYHAAGKVIGLSDNFLEIIEREHSYRREHDNWVSYNKWVDTRNPARADLEKKFGYDTKHGAHLVRLIRMCKEILDTGVVVVKRPDAQELLDIRNKGAWTYDQLVEWAEAQDAALEQSMKASKLPHHPDRKALNTLCIEVVEKMMEANK